MTKTEITYICEFGKGYYAQHQPNYEWSFTHDITKALQYKTLNGALDRLFAMGDLNGTHEYCQGRVLIERTATTTIVNNTTSFYATDKIISDANAYPLFQAKEKLRFQKRMDKKEKEIDSMARASEADRVKYQKIFKRNIANQEEYFKPKCINIQTELKAPDYVEKRNKLIIQKIKNNSYTQFFKPYHNDGISQIFSLYQLFNTIKILLDNNQRFVLEDNIIFVDNEDMEKVRTLFIREGVFNHEYCREGQNKLFEWS